MPPPEMTGGRTVAAAAALAGAAGLGVVLWSRMPVEELWKILGMRDPVTIEP